MEFEKIDLASKIKKGSKFTKKEFQNILDNISNKSFCNIANFNAIFKNINLQELEAVGCMGMVVDYEKDGVKSIFNIIYLEDHNNIEIKEVCTLKHIATIEKPQFRTEFLLLIMTVILILASILK